MTEDNASMENGFQVLFGNHDYHIKGDAIPQNTILITPSLDNWNDHGYKIRINYRVRAKDRDDVFFGSGFIGFITEDNEQGAGKDLLEEVTASNEELIHESRLAYRFFTMLPSMELYRQIVQELGPSVASNILRKVNDLVALSEFESNSNVLNLALNTKVFSLSFMRSTDAYFAYKNAGHILRGLSNEQKGIISQSLLINFKLSGLINDHTIKFNFDHHAILPKRIAVIIGKNGVGKSKTLGEIARSALNGGKSFTDGDGNRPLINRLIAFAPTNEANSVFPRNRRKLNNIWYRRFSLNRSHRPKGIDSISDLIVQLARSNQLVSVHSRWSIFEHTIFAITNPHQISLIRTGYSDLYIPIQALNISPSQLGLEIFASIDLRKDPVRVIDGKAYPLSSGEISFLKFAAQASLNIENGSLLLLDEPETHLHPNFISRFVSLLDNLLEMTGSAAIIATHSAYFVREVFRDQVSILKVDDHNEVQIQRPTLRTFGADVGAISYFVFGEDEPSRLAEEVENNLRKSNLTWNEIFDMYKDELSLETLSNLRSEIGDKKLQ